VLAHALELCIAAERRMPGSADRIIARQPAWTRAELRRLAALASSLDAAAASAVMSDEFRQGARDRLMRRIGGDITRPSTNGWLSTFPSRNSQTPVRRTRDRWMRRTALGALLASVLILAATLTASASALPGEPLYTLKQASEELGVRLAPDDQARTLLLLNQGNVRLDETARLLQLGRTDEVAEVTQRFDDTIDRATSRYSLALAEAPLADPTITQVETQLSQQEAQLQALIVAAPEPARADLSEALITTERGRALVADPQPPEAAASRPRETATEPQATPSPMVDTAELRPPTPEGRVIAPAPPPVNVVTAAEQHDTAPIVPQPADHVAHLDPTPAGQAHSPQDESVRGRPPPATLIAQSAHDAGDTLIAVEPPTPRSAHRKVVNADQPVDVQPANDRPVMAPAPVPDSGPPASHPSIAPDDGHGPAADEPVKLAPPPTVVTHQQPPPTTTYVASAIVQPVATPEPVAQGGSNGSGPGPRQGPAPVTAQADHPADSRNSPGPAHQGASPQAPQTPQASQVQTNHPPTATSHSQSPEGSQSASGSTARHIAPQSSHTGH
jgi:hypothetical protein